MERGSAKRKKRLKGSDEPSVPVREDSLSQRYVLLIFLELGIYLFKKFELFIHIRLDVRRLDHSTDELADESPGDTSV